MATGPRLPEDCGFVNYHASAPQAERVVAAISAAGGEAVAIQADVTAAGDVARLVGDIDQRWGGVDVLVHNALMPFAYHRISA